MLVNQHFFVEFGVEWIATKAVEVANVRRDVLTKFGYIPMNNFALDDYYGKVE